MALDSQKRWSLIWWSNSGGGYQEKRQIFSRTHVGYSSQKSLPRFGSTAPNHFHTLLPFVPELVLTPCLCREEGQDRICLDPVMMEYIYIYYLNCFFECQTLRSPY